MDILKPFFAIGNAVAQFFHKDEMVRKVVDLSELPVEIVGGTFRLDSNEEPQVSVTVNDDVKPSAPGFRRVLTGREYTLKIKNSQGEWVNFPLAQKFSFSVSASGCASVEVEFLDHIRKPKE